MYSSRGGGQVSGWGRDCCPPTYLSLMGYGSLCASLQSRSCPAMPETPEKATSPGDDGKSLDTEPSSGKSATGERNLV